MDEKELAESFEVAFVDDGADDDDSDYNADDESCELRMKSRMYIRARMERQDLEQRLKELQLVVRDNTEHYQAAFVEYERRADEAEAGAEAVRQSSADGRVIERLEHAKAQADDDKQYLAERVQELERELAEASKRKSRSSLRDEVQALKHLLGAVTRVEHRRLRDDESKLRKEHKSLCKETAKLKNALDAMGVDTDAIDYYEDYPVDDSDASVNDSDEEQLRRDSKKSAGVDLSDDLATIDAAKDDYKTLAAIDKLRANEKDLEEDLRRLRAESSTLVAALRAVAKKDSGAEEFGSLMAGVSDTTEKVERFIDDMHLADDIRLAAALRGKRQWNGRTKNILERRLDADLSELQCSFVSGKLLPVLHEPKHQDAEEWDEIAKLKDAIEKLQVVLVLFADDNAQAYAALERDMEQVPEHYPASGKRKLSADRRRKARRSRSREDDSEFSDDSAEDNEEEDFDFVLAAIEEKLRKTRRLKAVGLGDEDEDFALGPFGEAFGLLQIRNERYEVVVENLENALEKLEKALSTVEAYVRDSDAAVSKATSSGSSSLPCVDADDTHWFASYVRALQRYLEKKNMNHDLEMAQLLFFSKDDRSLALPSWWRAIAIADTDKEQQYLARTPMYVTIETGTLKQLIESVNKLKNCLDLVSEVQTRIIYETLAIPELKDDQISEAVSDAYQEVVERFPDVDFKNVSGSLAKLIGVTSLARLWAKDDASARAAALKVLCTYSEECFKEGYKLEQVDWTALYETLDETDKREHKAMHAMISNLLKAMNVSSPEELQLKTYVAPTTVSGLYEAVLTTEDIETMVPEDVDLIRQLQHAVADKNYDIWTLSLLCDSLKQVARTWRKGAIAWLRNSYHGEVALERLPLPELLEELFKSPPPASSGTVKAVLGAPPPSMVPPSEVPMPAKKKKKLRTRKKGGLPRPTYDEDNDAELGTGSSASSSGSSGSPMAEELSDDEKKEDLSPKADSGTHTPVLLDAESEHSSVMAAVKPVKKSELLKKDIEVHKAKVTAFHSHSGGKLFGSVDIRGVIKFWKVSTSGGWCKAFLTSHLPKLPTSKFAVGHTAAFSRCGHWFAVGGSVDSTETFGVIYLFPISEASDGMHKPQSPLVFKSGDVSNCQFSAICSLVFDKKGNQLIAGDGNGHVFSFKVSSGGLQYVTSAPVHSSDRVIGLDILETGKNKVLFVTDKHLLLGCNYKTMCKSGGKPRFHNLTRDRSDSLPITGVHCHEGCLIVASRKLQRYAVDVSKAGIILSKDRKFIISGLPSDWISQIDATPDEKKLVLSFDDSTTPLPLFGVVYFKDKRWQGFKRDTKKLGEVAFAAAVPSDKKGNVVLCLQKYEKSRGKKAHKKPGECKMKVLTYDELGTGSSASSSGSSHSPVEDAAVVVKATSSVSSSLPSVDTDTDERHFLKKDVEVFKAKVTMAQLFFLMIYEELAGECPTKGVKKPTTKKTAVQKLKDATKRNGGKKTAKKKSAAMAVTTVRKVREVRVAESDVEKEHIYLMCAYWFRLEAGVSGVEAANQIPADIVTLVHKFLHKSILGRPSVELKQAFEDGHADVPRILHAQGVDIVKAKAPCCKNCSALDYACKKGHWEVIEVLMSAGADPRECERSDGMSSLLLALDGGHKKVTKKLIEYGCDINARSIDGMSALHLACCHNFKDIAQLLVDAGADIEAKGTALKASPFFMAFVNGHMEMADFMLSVGADINAMSEIGGVTAFMYVALTGNVPLLKWLMDRGCDITIKNRDGLDAFICAGIAGHLDACRFVVEHSCGDVELRREDGLKLAVFLLNVEATEVFLAVGADANAVFDDGVTILMIAAESGNLDIVNLLINNGANVLTTDNENDDALAHATKEEEYLVALFLEMEKAKALSLKEAGE